MTNFQKAVKYIRPHDIWDLTRTVAAFLPGMILKLFKRDIWLVSERAEDAHDNGYWFFKYARENYPEKNIFYTISFSCDDYINKIKPLGNAINHGSFKHHIYMWACSKFVSAHIGDSYPGGLISRLFVIYKLYRFKFFFLQHGVIKTIPPFLYKEKNNLTSFVVSSEYERQAVIKDLHYSPNEVPCLGLCRYDNLNEFKVNKKRILVMPTWRWWLSPKHDRSINETVPFGESLYFKSIKEIFVSEELQNFLHENNLELLYFPHFEMQPYLDEFKKSCPNLLCADIKKYDVQQALKESAILITDYSSIDFDFAYMKKPVVYYHFDYEEFTQKHYPKGYFDYNINGFGYVAHTADEVVDIVKKSFENGFSMEEKFCKRVDDFFAFRDNENTKRNFEYVLNY